ncbi:developmental pluripotency-associated protein 2-like isoform X2 [Sceloporus undulatus]|uniref:developmental pluripotency-associated protein 2-like isoform X2 n=1 Tax=Sceloporus undulatus TaxID=8520 RepID=UPI001C4CBE2D|nr:developmental pluripotency-associated protein 2-like isoform X2 [Sceloporus undulatus]
MPRQGRKVAKSVSTPPQCTPANGSSCQLPQKTTSVDYHVLKRAQLQQQCKKLGIRATGKNAELVERLKAFHKEPLLETGNGEEENTKKNEEQGQKTQQGSCIPTATTYRFCTKSGPNSAVAPHESKKGTKKAPPAVTHVDLVNEIKTEPSEEKTDLVRGWCVVHGMILYRPASSWSPLLLRGGMVCVQDGENIVPFHLPPLNISVPDGLSDNYVCQDCVLRNQEKPKRCLLCQQIPRKGSRVSLPKIDLTNVTAPLDSRSRPSLLETSISKDRRRTREIRKLYQAQEDQAYAQRVDGLLSQMARGELGMDLALRPLQPLVVHSPAPFER